MNLTKVSVIVPVYNVASFLSACIDSLLGQTLSDIQIILINDGSKDNSGSICDEYANKDSRVVVFHKKNEGVTKARALGVKYATGEWVMFVDGDDTLPSDALYRLYYKVNDNSCDIIQGCWFNFYGTYKRKGYLLRNGKMTGKEFIHQLLCGGAPVGILGKMIRKNLFDQDAMSIPSEITNNEDLLMNIYLAKKAKHVYFDAKGLIYNYSIREGSVSKRRLNLKKWDLLFSELRRSLSCDFDIDFYKYVIYMMVRLRFKIPEIDFTKSSFFDLCRINLHSYGVLSRVNISIQYLIRPNQINYNIVKFYILIAKLKRPLICLVNSNL